jgi:large subunit ribosomal protein L20
VPRAKNVVAHHERKKKIMKEARGFRGGRSKLYHTAKDAVRKANQHAYAHRRQRRRLFRRLWVVRINAAARLQGLSYSQFISGLQKANIEIDRKMLAELAVNQPEIFTEVARRAKEALAG